MINYNGNIIQQYSLPLADNRGFLYGDAVFETLKIVDNKILFIEDHYFRLMASMRIIRMDIPMNFTMEYMQRMILDLTDALGVSSSSRVRITFFRKPGGKYLPFDNDAEFIITAESLDSVVYGFTKAPYEVDIYKDFYVPKHLISTLKTTNRLINITGSIYAHENGLDNCLLLNEDKNVVESLNGNIFMLLNGKLVTPPLSNGCLNGIMRKQIINLAKKVEGIEVVEGPISPFELQKADELFVTNIITGIQPIRKYRKKEYKDDLATEIVKRLNALIRLSS